MKIKPFFLFAFLLSSIALVSCIDADETDEVIIQRDIESIQEYLEENELDSVKQYSDYSRGILVVWQEVSNSGIKVDLGDTLSVEYTGKLLSNKIFDTSIESVARANGIFVTGRQYIPLKFPIGRNLLLPGFEIGLLQMEKGDKATVFMSSVYGYGNNPPSGDIPQHAPLIFEMNLIDIKPGPQN